MQYVGKVGGYMYNQWNSLNPATLLGAIDIIVIEQPDGSYHCSPFHIRFGKFQIIKPLQKKIDFFVNDIKTDLPMKLGDGGEAFFVFETTNNNLISQSVLTSPVISAASSPEGSPNLSPSSTNMDNDFEGFDLNGEDHSVADDLDSKIQLTNSRPNSPTPTPSISSKLAFEKAKKVTQKLNIPSKIDNNGDMVLDMDGYKPNSQKNIDNSDEMLKKIFIEELKKLGQEQDSVNQVHLWDQIIKMDEDGNIRISNIQEGESSEEISLAENEQYANVLALAQQQDLTNSALDENSEKTFFKTLRLTSEQLKSMNLNYGQNKLLFKLNQGNSQVSSNLYLWKSSTPIVISDIDGTITKSDALGHLLNLVGKDWTHPGVAKLFQDIHSNGYNIVYLTARSVGQADSTRQYLQSIVQENNIKLPSGPVILSPDRTMAALKREVILKKPEVFKMSCLNDIRSLYYNHLGSDDKETANLSGNSSEKTPFYAGFGNRITDAISYRSVNIPSHRIFTINPDGDVHMELLELSGVKSSYLGIGELVDQYFPPVSELSDFLNSDQTKIVEERFNDFNYWRDPINLSDLTDIEDDEPTPEPKSPSLLSMRSFGSDTEKKSPKIPQERPSSISSFTSPLKGFMGFNKGPEDSFDYGDDTDENEDVQDLDITYDNDNVLEGGDSGDDYEGDDYDEDADDDYIDDDYDEDADDDYDEDAEDEDDEAFEDEDDYDEEDPLAPAEESQETPGPEHPDPVVHKASDLIKDMKLS